MRKNPTEPEIRLWKQLRGSRLNGHKFRRQANMGFRIADFFCPAKGLLVEVDGHTHDPDADRLRDADILARFGYTTIRFTNEDIMRNMDGVLIALVHALDRQPDRWPGRAAHHPPAPSSEEEGE